MIFTTVQIISWLRVYKYAILFPVAMFEGPIITIIAGYLASLGFLNFFIAYGIVILGDTVGDILYYLAGRWGSMQFCQRWGRFFDVATNRVAKLEKYFDVHAGKTLFLGKFAYGIVGTMLFAAGVGKVSFKKFLGFTLSATLIKSFLLLLTGFYFGSAYEQIKQYFDYTAYITIALALLLLAGFFLLQRFARRELDIQRNEKQ